jgi:protein-tyrosine phosphatase
MIDIHTHIVWGVDDGAETLQQSLNMLRIAVECGSTDLVATPHYNRSWTPDAALVRNRIQELMAACGSAPRIHRGWEVNLHPLSMEAALASPAEFTINQAGYILLELPHWTLPANMRHILQSFRERGMRPIIAHPERNPALMQMQADLEVWVREGCLLQLTAQSVTGEAGAEAREAAWELLRKGWVSIVASDSHDDLDRTPDLRPARRAIEAKLGAPAAERMFVTVPQCVLSGSEPPPEPTAPGSERRGKKRFRFWR